ncbi:MAG: hypothetical protein JNM85_10155 [Chthonomonas sp.]|nr:hypothetical protein [Chthonomonas sp.]
MNHRLKKFWKLWHISHDRELTDREEYFVLNLMREAPEIEAEAGENEKAFAALRDESMDVTPSPEFDARLLRMAKVQFGRDQFRYWSPALAGACIAAVAVFAILQALSQPIDPTDLRGKEARRVSIDRTVFPEPSTSLKFVTP